MNELPDFAKNSRLLTREQVMELLGIKSTLLCKLTSHKNANIRIPSYQITRKCRKYKYDEVMYWLEKRKS